MRIQLYPNGDSLRCILRLARWNQAISTMNPSVVSRVLLQAAPRPKCDNSLLRRGGTFYLLTLNTLDSKLQEPAVSFLHPQSAVFRFDREPGSENPLRVISWKIPGLVVPQDSGAFRWWSSLRTIFKRVKPSGPLAADYPFRNRAARRGYFRGRSLVASIAFHCAAILLIVRLHQAFPDSVDAFDSPDSQPEVIYYRVPVQQLPKTLPHIAPAGRGGHPLSGPVPDRPPAPGSSTSRGVLTIVSKPAHPDNYHQTIIQPSSPPELKITVDLKLPNIILGKPIEAPKAPLQFNPSASKPTRRDRQTNADPAPSPAQENSATPLMTFLTPPAFKPSLPVPVTQGTAVQRKSASGTGNVQAPNVTAATSGDSATLAVISTDPAGATSMAQIMLPPGNRSGEFSISATDSLVGSPGGSRAGVTGGGSGTAGKGGDGSTGIGPSSSGGGGLSLSEAPVTISGEGTNSSGSGMLGEALARGIIYPVPAAFNIRRNSLIVSAGPIGGGGLNAYGALLHCGKIYTIFLPMPGKNWTMQYCAQNSPDTAQSAAQSSNPSAIAHFGEGVVPPQAESKFDFQRVPVPPEKVGKQIILKGVLRTDGFIDELQVYQSVLSEMDDNARLAFSQWKFKPALREGKPIPVQVLVGIPAQVPIVAPPQ